MRKKYFKRFKIGKKILNKKIWSICEIQNCVLSTKERKKRDNVLRREKNKEVSVVEHRIVNLSLSDSDISNKGKMILREPKNAWEVGKKLALSIQGMLLMTYANKGLVKEEALWRRRQL